MQQFSSLLSWRLFTAQDVSGVLPPIIRGSMTSVATSGFTATAVIELLMMGGRTPETCWAVNKRQDNKLENCCIWLVICLNCTIMHGLTNLKFRIKIFIFLISVHKYQINTDKCIHILLTLLCLVDRASFVNTLFIFQLDTLLFSLYIYNFLLTIFSTCFGRAGLSSGESNYTCSLWHLSLVRCYLVRGRWC